MCSTHAVQHPQLALLLTITGGNSDDVAGNAAVACKGLLTEPDPDPHAKRHEIITIRPRR
jgi:hypothetical protein